MSSYADVVIPKDKDPKQFSFTERRAELLKAIRAAGHPNSVNRHESAARYGVTPQMISVDFKAIAKDSANNLGKNSDLLMDAVFTKTVRKLQSEGKDYLAAKLVFDWMEFLFKSGARIKAAERIEVVGSASEERVQAALAELKGKKWLK